MESEKNIENIKKHEMTPAGLRQFILGYHPEGFQEGVKIGTIQNMLHSFVEIFPELLALHEAGELEDEIDRVFEEYIEGKYKDKWYIKEAVIAFFNQEEAEQNEQEEE